MSLHRNTLVFLTVAAIVATSVTPSFASKNDHRYAESSEGRMPTPVPMPQTAAQLTLARDGFHHEPQVPSCSRASSCRLSVRS